MATEQYLQSHFSTGEEGSFKKWNSVSDAFSDSEDNPSKGLDCNICLESAQDPVVTLCGHLYCWPCIYKWLYFQSISNETPGQEQQQQQQQQCPVCKADVSHSSLVPLYGRGETAKLSECKDHHLGLVIPRRPSSPASTNGPPPLPTLGDTAARPAPRLRRRRYLNHWQPYLETYGDSSSPVLELGGSMTEDDSHQFPGMFGEIMYARMFGNSSSNLYSYTNSYQLAGTGNPRVRRHLMQSDKSLSRICFFLCCCALMCLLLF